VKWSYKRPSKCEYNSETSLSNCRVVALISILSLRLRLTSSKAQNCRSLRMLPLPIWMKTPMHIPEMTELHHIMFSEASHIHDSFGGAISLDGIETSVIMKPCVSGDSLSANSWMWIPLTDIATQHATSGGWMASKSASAINHIPRHSHRASAA
jgi:hypothetical protein